MITQLFRITPPGDNQSNTNLNSQAVVAYEQSFDIHRNIWNAKRGCTAQLIYPLGTILSVAGSPYTLPTQFNINASKIALIIAVDNFTAGLDTLSIQLIRKDPITGANRGSFGAVVSGDFATNAEFAVPSGVTQPIVQWSATIIYTGAGNCSVHAWAEYSAY